MKQRLLLIILSLYGICGVTLGAFGAHKLKDFLTAHQMASTWETAVLYHLIHTVAALAVVAGCTSQSAAAQRWLSRAAVCWLLGVIMFSGSLYVLALGGPHWLGPITPLGGLAFMAGWACLLPAMLSKSGS